MRLVSQLQEARDIGAADDFDGRTTVALCAVSK